LVLPRVLMVVRAIRVNEENVPCATGQLRSSEDSILAWIAVSFWRMIQSQHFADIHQVSRLADAQIFTQTLQ
jgi:hypothetical protein